MNMLHIYIYIFYSLMPYSAPEIRIDPLCGTGAASVLVELHAFASATLGPLSGPVFAVMFSTNYVLVAWLGHVRS